MFCLCFLFISFFLTIYVSPIISTSIHRSDLRQNCRVGRTLAVDDFFLGGEGEVGMQLDSKMLCSGIANA